MFRAIDFFFNFWLSTFIFCLSIGIHFLQVESDLEVTRDRVEDLEDLDLEFMLTEKCKLVEELPEKIHKKEKRVQTMKKKNI